MREAGDHIAVTTRQVINCGVVEPKKTVDGQYVKDIAARDVLHPSSYVDFKEKFEERRGGIIYGPTELRSNKVSYYKFCFP